MILVLLGVAVAVGVALIVTGAWLERRGKRITHPAIRVRESVPAGSAARPALTAHARRLIAQHPTPVWGWLEVALWGFVLLTLIDHLGDRRDSLTARIVWALTIGPHEIGHVVCAPFGWVLGFAGGSIWQVVLWAGLAIYVFVRRRQITASLVFWAITGHSLINLSVYIGDARARDLPLLFGMDSSHHDWWNLLDHFGLLAYDHIFAAGAILLGAGIIFGAAVLGIMAAWAIPYAGGRAERLPHGAGGFWAAMRRAGSPSQTETVVVATDAVPRSPYTDPMSDTQAE